MDLLAINYHHPKFKFIGHWFSYLHFIVPLNTFHQRMTLIKTAALSRVSLMIKHIYLRMKMWTNSALNASRKTHQMNIEWQKNFHLLIYKMKKTRYSSFEASRINLKFSSVSTNRILKNQMAKNKIIFNIKI